MNERFSKNWDLHLNYLLDNFEFTNIETCSAYLGNEHIWIENYPYDCFTPYLHNAIGFRASRLTILRARKKLFTHGYDPYQIKNLEKK
jgi:hypothetical protein